MGLVTGPSRCPSVFPGNSTVPQRAGNNGNGRVAVVTGQQLSPDLTCENSQLTRRAGNNGRVSRTGANMIELPGYEPMSRSLASLR